MVFVPAAVCRAARKGADSILRTQAFVVRLILALQRSGFDAMASNMASFRAACNNLVHQQGAQCETVLAFSHSWDETKQMLREPARQPHARESSQKVARNIIVQTSLVFASAFLRESNGRELEHTRSEVILVPPLELYGKTASFILAALQRGCIFPFFTKPAMHALTDNASTVIMSFWGDAASTNRKALRHIVGFTETQGWPQGALVDVGQVCLLHQIHRIKVQLVDCKGMVSLMFCLSKLVKAGTILELIADHLAKTVQSHCRRVVGAPPPEGVAQTKRVLDAIFKLEASHHILFGKRGQSKSTLLKDLEVLMSLDNGGLRSSTGDIVHYCWDGSGPCCADLDDTVQKLTGAYFNLFVGRSMPVATLSRWTNVLTVCAMLCAGYACRDIYVQALVSGLAAEGPAGEDGELQAADAGAGDQDLAKEHRARVAKVKTWLTKGQTRAQVGTCFLMLRNLDSLTYYLMGGERPDQGRHRQPGTVPRAEQTLPAKELCNKVAHTLAHFRNLLLEYGVADSDAMRFFHDLGLNDEDMSTESFVRVFRRAMVGASAGVYRRLWLRLSTFPVKLHLLVDAGVAQDERERCAEEFLALPDCCLGVFGRGLKRRCPTMELLLGLRGKAIIKTWLRTVQWSIYACEKEHASCRRLCNGHGPGRKWTLVSRERVLEGVRSVHIDRCDYDPARAMPPQQQKKRKASEVDDSGTGEEQQNPLYLMPARLPLALPPCSQLPLPLPALGAPPAGEANLGQLVLAEGGQPPAPGFGSLGAATLGGACGAVGVAAPQALQAPANSVQKPVGSEGDLQSKVRHIPYAKVPCCEVLPNSHTLTLRAPMTLGESAVGHTVCATSHGPTQTG